MKPDTEKKFVVSISAALETAGWVNPEEATRLRELAAKLKEENEALRWHRPAPGLPSYESLRLAFDANDKALAALLLVVRDACWKLSGLTVAATDGKNLASLVECVEQRLAQLEGAGSTVRVIEALFKPDPDMDSECADGCAANGQYLANGPCNCILGEIRFALGLRREWHAQGCDCDRCKTGETRYSDDPKRSAMRA